MIKRVGVFLGAVLLTGITGLTSPLSPAHAQGGGSDVTTLDSASSCEVRSWEVLWGVKESFRSYLSGSLANGEWNVSGDVTYSTPLFTIRGSDGVLAPDVSSGDLATTGSIGFFGHEGLLDQTLSTPRLVINGDEVDVVFDISGDTQEGRTVSAQNVSFVSVDAAGAVVDSEAGTWSVNSAPTVLTAEGAEAFGTYPAGEAFDPIDIRVQVDPGCLQPPLSTPWFFGLALGSVVTVSLAIVLVRRWRGRERPTPEVS
ncbi:Secreted iron transport protein Htaa [Pontimonas salivibrio]|uniref:Secreted iron transport protein Htaa n=1 Tax=Pontimonas salivibrio TaxID=1159327 RepID=A0A2L2BP23_9MICO|nr:HtaA domain-containing protein [Pontimonas salivibrio]AVG23413.1 Secreted iron transport protein Htaa [Pontimonas salivibrio]